MRNKILSLLLALTLVLSTGVSVFAEVDLDNPPTQPQVEDYHDNDKIEEYNKQVDEYNAEVTEYNNQVDKTYEEDCAKYEEEKAAVEANNTFVENVENKIETDSSEARGFENNTTEAEDIPTDWSDEVNENPKTIQIEKSETPTGETVKVINLHVYLKENVTYNDLEPTFYNSINNYSFDLSENLKNNAILTEWEIAEIDYDDTVTLVSESIAFAGNIVWINGKRSWMGAAPSPYFMRSIEGYTQGYWTPGGDMLATTATEQDYGWSAGTAYIVHHAEETATSHYLLNGQPMTEEITVRTTDKQEPKNIFALFTYIFTRLADEPEEEELPNEPIKEAYLSYLNKMDLFTVPTIIPENPTPPPESTSLVQPTTDNPVYSMEDPEDNIQIADTQTPTTIINNPTPIINNPTPKAEPEGSWALINLIATILACICALALLFVRKDTEDDEPTDEEKKDMRKILATKIASILVGIISVIAFILTEDMSLPMVLTDKWTFLMILLLIIEIVNIFIIRRQSKGEEDNDSN